jgi:hypothetical protein
MPISSYVSNAKARSASWSVRHIVSIQHSKRRRLVTREALEDLDSGEAWSGDKPYVGMQTPDCDAVTGDPDEAEVYIVARRRAVFGPISLDSSFVL